MTGIPLSGGIRDRLDRRDAGSDRGQSAATADLALRRRGYPGVVRPVTFVVLKPVSAFATLRESREYELRGLDISQLGEALQQNSACEFPFSALLLSTIMFAAQRASD